MGFLNIQQQHIVHQGNTMLTVKGVSYLRWFNGKKSIQKPSQCPFSVPKLNSKSTITQNNINLGHSGYEQSEIAL